MHGVLVKAGEITTYHWRGRSCHTSVLRKSIQRGWLLISPELHSGEILFVATDVIWYKERSHWSDVRRLRIYFISLQRDVLAVVHPS